MGKSRWKLRIALICFLLPGLSGCWDEVEIEDRAFLTAVAIDLAEEQGTKTMFEVTEQLVIPTGLGTTTQQGGGKAYRNLSASSESIFEANSNIWKQDNRKGSIEHLSIIIVSKEIAEKEKYLANVLDVFIRQQYMRRGILLAIANGKAKDLLDIENEHVKLPSQYMSELLENVQSSISPEPARIGDIQEKLLTNRSYFVPQLMINSEKQIEYEGIAVIQEPTSKVVGTLMSDELKGRQIIIGEFRDGSITATIEGEQATFDIMEDKSTYKLLNRDKNKLIFQVDIEVTAGLVEFFGTVDLNKRENLKKFENALKNEVEKISESAIKKVKDDFKVDVLEFDEFLRRKHYNFWKEIEPNWDEGKNYFSQSEIQLNITTTIKEPGTSIRVNSKGD